MILAYLRVSTAEQAKSGLGLDAQLEAIRKAVGEPDQTFRDEGISGKRSNRPGLSAALKSLKRGDQLVVAKRDRLARDTFLALWIEKEAKKRGASIISAAGEGNGDSPTDQLLRDIMNAFASFESARIGERTADAWERQRARGKKCGGAIPFGFAVDGEGQLHPVDEEQEAISLMRKMREQEISYRAIGAALEDMGYQRRYGSSKWHPQAIKQILEMKQGIPVGK